MANTNKYMNSTQIKSYNIPWPTNEDIPLIAISPLPVNFMDYVHQFYNQYPDKVIQEVNIALKTVEECGCTTISAGGTFEQMDAIVRATRIDSKGIDLNINVILSPEYLNMSPSTTLKILTHYGATKNFNNGEYTPFVNQDKIVAWLIMNQPHFWDWGDTLALQDDKGTDYVWNRLTTGYGIARYLDHYYKTGQTPTSSSPKRLSFFNLAAVPDKTSTSGSALRGVLGSCDTYKEYLDVLDKLYEPKVWCYNYFPFFNILNPNGTITGTSLNLDEFFRYLILFRNKISNPRVREINPTFWNYAMTIEHKYINASGITEWHRPAPTVGMLRLQVFCTLAFGAKGIVYYMYGSQRTNVTSDGRIIYGKAPLDCEISGSGINSVITFKKTEIWDAIKTVNLEVKSWREIFVKSKVVTCFTMGRIINGLVSFPNKYICINSLQIGAKGVIISHRVIVPENNKPTGKTQHYFVFVNLDYENEQTIEISFKEGYDAKFIEPSLAASSEDYKSTLSTVSGESVYSRTLSSGGITVITFYT